MAAAFLSDTFYAAKLFPLRNPFPGSYTTLDNLPWRHVMWQGSESWNMHGFVSTQGFWSRGVTQSFEIPIWGVVIFVFWGGNSMIYLCLCFPYWLCCFFRFCSFSFCFVVASCATAASSFCLQVFSRPPCNQNDFPWLHKSWKQKPFAILTLMLC